MKILTIDDHQLYQAGIQLILDQLFPASTVLSANNISDAFSLFPEHIDTDIILLDVCMPDGGAATVLKKLYMKNLAIPVLVVSASGNSTDIFLMINLGALGYFLKSSPPSELKHAIETILQGNEYFPEEWQKSQKSPKSVTYNDGNYHISITPRLYEVLQLIEKGCSTSEINRLLKISKHTVRDYTKELFLRFDVHSRTELLQLARQLNFFSH